MPSRCYSLLPACAYPVCHQLSEANARSVGVLWDAGLLCQPAVPVPIPASTPALTHTPLPYSSRFLLLCRPLSTSQPSPLPSLTCLALDKVPSHALLCSVRPTESAPAASSSFRDPQTPSLRPLSSSFSGLLIPVPFHRPVTLCFRPLPHLQRANPCSSNTCLLQEALFTP